MSDTSEPARSQARPPLKAPRWSRSRVRASAGAARCASGAAARKRQALQGPQAARAAGAVRPRRPRRRLGAVRDVHGRRVGPAAARGSRAHQPSMIVDAARPRDRHADRQRAPDLPLRDQIAPVMKHAIVAIEDRRFYTNSGVDLRGIARAAVAGRHRRRRGPGRFDDPAAVREDLARRRERAHRLPEAARGRARLPPHAQVVQGPDPAQLPELDLLRQRRLRDRVGRAHLLRVTTTTVRRQQDSPTCASVLQPHEAALLAAIVASPSAYDPIQHPVAAKRRRDLVLLRMFEQGYLTPSDLRRARRPSRCRRATT